MSVPYVLWDASALVKRYVTEAGTAAVDSLFATIPLSQMATTILSYSEAFAALLRKHNRGGLFEKLLITAQSALRHEIIEGPDFAVLEIEFDDIIDGIDLIRQHNLNSADAAILGTFIRHARLLSASAVIALAASDKRLLRAATGEGLQTINPETVSSADLAALANAIAPG